MAYNIDLDMRIEDATSGWGTVKKKMFGGTCHILNGNMMCGVHKDYLILRLGEEESSRALSQPHVKPFDMTGKPMKGWVTVEAEGYDGEALGGWLAKAKAFALTLPPK